MSFTFYFNPLMAIQLDLRSLFGADSNNKLNSNIYLLVALVALVMYLYSRLNSSQLLNITDPNMARLLLKCITDKDS